MTSTKMQTEIRIDPVFHESGLLDYPFLIDGEFTEIIFSGPIQNQNLILKITYRTQGTTLYYEVRVAGVTDFHLTNASRQNVISETYYQNTSQILNSPEVALNKFSISGDYYIQSFIEKIKENSLCLLEFDPTAHGQAHILCLCKGFEIFSIETRGESLSEPKH